jgi:N-hydroxyarylamine O-acetyltransferase
MNLDAYLNRIGYTGPRTATLETLRALSALHPAAIAFENFDSFLGGVPRLDAASLQDKLVARRRGGYCYEQNALLRDVLQALGAQVTALAARVVWMAPPQQPVRPASHMLLLVRLDGDAAEYIVDVGFGGHLFGVPLVFEPGLEQPGPMSLLRIVEAEGAYTVETRLPAGWAPIYRFTLTPMLPVDYEPLNWFTATHPASMFRHNLLLERLLPTVRSSLFNDRLIVRRPGVPPEIRRLADAADFERLLGETFGLTPPVPAAQLYERLPKGLDGLHLPAA